MKRKLPPNAFEFYVGLGAQRSYKAVADHYGASKTAVTNLAERERWQDRVAAVERAARERSDQRAIETIESMNARHLRTLQVIQGKALERLKVTQLETAMDAVRALDLSIRQERLIRGEPSERTAIDLEDLVRREYQRWTTPETTEASESTRVSEATEDSSGGGA